MKTLKLTSLIGALLFLAGSNSALVTSSRAGESPNPRASDLLAPQTDAVVAYNAATALRHLASARRDIFRNDIPDAQTELGKVLTAVSQMKSRFPEGRVEELIAGARIRLSYQEPRKVLAYVELIAPTLENVSAPVAANEVKRALARAEDLLKISDKDAADRELGAFMDLLVYQSPARPVMLAERHLRTAAAELDQQHKEAADQALAAVENNLNLIAFGPHSPLSETQKALRQAALDHASGRLAAVKASLEQASRATEKTLKDTGIQGREELQDLDGEIKILLGKSAPRGEQWAKAIKGLWERGESLTERAIDYNTMRWEMFQSSRSDAADLIEAKLHVGYAESYELTTGETQKALIELDKAEAALRKAAPAVRESEKTTMNAAEKDLQAVKAELGKNQAGQHERYETIRNTLSRLIH